MTLTTIWPGVGLGVLLTLSLAAQPDRWQQAVRYDMDIDFDVSTHRYEGKQTLTYTNRSPDTLDRVFYHLYFNAFQPGSAMDVRSRTIGDADPRVASRIAELGPNEIGYQLIKSLTQDGAPVRYETVGTILEVSLARPILPGQSTVLRMEYQAQVPLQIRRSGRNNQEGIDYSMAQWYPKLAEYDYQGWHANPYIGREFYGVWGDFDVRIRIDKNYIVGGTGYLQNPAEIGHGYTDQPVAHTTDKITYHFVAPNVHDFVWAADPDYTHTRYPRADGTVLHFFYQDNDNTRENWTALPGIMDRAFDFVNRNYGQYPYQQYSFIQGGDGGMEYPMATLITGERNLSSLVGVSVHELMHSWYQMILGTNESLYAWMDEGFTSWSSGEVMNWLQEQQLLPGTPVEYPNTRNFAGFGNFAKGGNEEPLSTHADHFTSNRAYGVGAYTKGSIFLEQLRHVVGETAFRRGLHRYYHDWKFKHPNPNDFIRIMEKESDLELDWYREYMVNTTATADYAIDTVVATGTATTRVTLAKLGRMPMPADLLVELTDGSKLYFNIPLEMMRGAKPAPAGWTSYTVLPDWSWVMPTYTVALNVPQSRIQRIALNPTGQIVDTEPANNEWMPTTPRISGEQDE